MNTTGSMVVGAVIGAITITAYYELMAANAVEKEPTVGKVVTRTVEVPKEVIKEVVKTETKYVDRGFVKGDIEFTNTRGEYFKADLNYPNLDIDITDPDDEDINSYYIQISPSKIKVDANYNIPTTCDDALADLTFKKLKMSNKELTYSCSQFSATQVSIDLSPK